MDVTLNRILTLIPKKPDGKFIHGAKKEFATRIGYDDGQIVSMWENGTSVSYKKKLHEIAMKYDVSVEWLKGETDDPKPVSTPGENGQKNNPLPDWNGLEVSENDMNHLAAYHAADEKTRAAIDLLLQRFQAEQVDE